MYQQNKKNGNLILIKKRRILTRTEQSQQKLQANLNTNNTLFKTPNKKSSQTIHLQKQQNHSHHHQTIQNKNLDQNIFWNTAKKKNIKAQFHNRQKTYSLIEFLSPKKHINPNDHQKLHTKCPSKMFGIFKKKIFSHKTLRQGIGKIRNNISQTALRINNQESVQNETPSKKLQIEESEDGTERQYYLKGIKEFTKRFKTEDTEREVNVQRIIQSIYSNRRRKLRLNSNEFSVELRINRKPQNLQKEKADNVRQQGSSITMKTSNQKALLKLPKQLNNQLISKSNKSECSSSANLNYSSDYDHAENKSFAFNPKNMQPPKILPFHRNKSKTLTSHQTPNIDQQQHTITQIGSFQPQDHQLSNQQDRRFIKKNSFHHAQNPNKPISQSQTISIHDIQVVCFNQIPQIDLVSQNIIKKQKFNKKIDNQIVKANTSSLSIINQKLLERKSKQIAQNDDEQICFIQEINFYQPKQQKAEPIAQKTENIIQKVAKNLTNNFETQSQVQVLSNSEKEIKPKDLNKTKSFPDQLTKSQQNEKVKQIANQQKIQQFILSKSYVQSLNFIGEVGGECSQFFPKKNLSWMVPTLLLYTYCMNFRNSAKNVFQQALKDQLLDENSFQQFFDQNQQLQQNITKIYQKTKKKDILPSQIQFFLLPNFDFRKEKLNLIQKSYIYIVDFLNLFLKNQEKKSLYQKQSRICAIKMIRAFLLVLKIECQKKSRQVQFRFTQKKKKQMFNVPEINLNDLGEKESDRLFEMEFKVMKENFDIFCQFMSN